MKTLITLATVTLLIALLLVQSPAAAVELDIKEATETCSQLTSCIDCLYDATSIVFNRRQVFSCAWCPTTGKCAQSFGNECPANRTLERNGKCEGMSCSGAHWSGNIYMCRAGMIIAIIVAVLLIFVSVGYGIWYRAIQQAPWRYDNLDRALLTLMETHGGAWAAAQKAAKPDILSADSVYRVYKKEEHRQTYDEWAFGSTEEERFWTQCKRYAFFPLAISSLAGVMSTILLFMTSLRPYFADWYYAIMLTVGYGSVCIMAIYVRLFQPTSSSQGGSGAPPQTYWDLAVFLHGRSLRNCFPISDIKKFSGFDKKQVEMKIADVAGDDAAAASGGDVAAASSAVNDDDNNNQDKNKTQSQQQGSSSSRKQHGRIHFKFCLVIVGIDSRCATGQFATS